MTWHLTILLLNLLLLSCSGLVLTMVLRTSRRVIRLLNASSTKSLTALDAEVAELTSAFSSLSTTVKRMNSRDHIAARREQTKQGRMPDLSAMSPQERKQALRKGLANGTLRAIKDDGSNHEV